MEIIARIFNCNYETYKLFYKDAIKKAFSKDKVNINENDIKIQIDNLPGDTIQAQRSPSGRHSRTITVITDGVPKYIIGFSNTGYDEDRKKESDNGGRQYIYGNSDYHSNSFMCQGINKIFEYYYDTKRSYPNVKLYFYLLDIGKKSYVDNLSNNLTYRELYTIGFEILNIEDIPFHEFYKLGFSREEYGFSYEYISFNKFANDLAYISSKNSSNAPAYLKCIDFNYDIDEEADEKEINDYSFKDLTNTQYIYTFKTLGAQSYDNFLAMWTLNTLAEKEDKNLKFEFSKEKFNFRLEQPNDNIKWTEDFPDTITRLFEKIGIYIKYESSEEVRQQFNRELVQYEKARRSGKIRNQELFKNNLRAKGLQTKCYLCGCEVEEILEAAHLWGVADIKSSESTKINKVIEIDCMKKLLLDPVHSSEQFYKKYVLANSGDNGIWLCNNHHELFDRNYYCFNSENGKVLLKADSDEIFKNYMSLSEYDKLPQNILTECTKVFLNERQKNFDSVEE